MTAERLVLECNKRGIELFLKTGGRVGYRAADAAVITPRLLDTLRTHKARIVAVLQPTNVTNVTREEASDDSRFADLEAEGKSVSDSLEERYRQIILEFYTAATAGHSVLHDAPIPLRSGVTVPDPTNWVKAFVARASACWRTATFPGTSERNRKDRLTELEIMNDELETVAFWWHHYAL